MRVDSSGNIFVEVGGKEYEVDISYFHPPDAGFVGGSYDAAAEPIDAEIEWTLLDNGKEAKDALSKLTDDDIEQIDQDLIAHYMEQYNVR